MPEVRQLVRSPASTPMADWALYFFKMSRLTAGARELRAGKIPMRVLVFAALPTPMAGLAIANFVSVPTRSRSSGVNSGRGSGGGISAERE